MGKQRKDLKITSSIDRDLRRDLLNVLGIGHWQKGDISGIILVKEFFKKGNEKLNYHNFRQHTYYQNP